MLKDVVLEKLIFFLIPSPALTTSLLFNKILFDKISPSLKAPKVTIKVTTFAQLPYISFCIPASIADEAADKTKIGQAFVSK